MRDPIPGGISGISRIGLLADNWIQTHRDCQLWCKSWTHSILNWHLWLLTHIRWHHWKTYINMVYSVEFDSAQTELWTLNLAVYNRVVSCMWFRCNQFRTSKKRPWWFRYFFKISRIVDRMQKPQKCNYIWCDIIMIWWHGGDMTYVITWWGFTCYAEKWTKMRLRRSNPVIGLFSLSFPYIAINRSDLDSSSKASNAYVIRNHSFINPTDQASSYNSGHIVNDIRLTFF